LLELLVAEPGVLLLVFSFGLSRCVVAVEEAALSVQSLLGLIGVLLKKSNEAENGLQTSLLEEV
jgi:hypothetical protein